MPVLYDKKGQLAIFIIIAVIIIALGILVYIFYPQISSTLGIAEQDPNLFIQTCMEDEIKSNIERLSLQGGFLNPSHYILYMDEKIQYLCYTENYYNTCVVQKPFLKKQIESELKKEIEDEARVCFDEMKSSFEKRGYDVTIKEGDISVKLLPQKIVSIFNYTATMEKTETKRYESFNIILDNNLYELVEIADSIVDWESTYGDADSMFYMSLYHNLKVEKRKPEYGTTVYILTERDTGIKFQFASRSVVFPPGYGIEQA